jgi:tetratricopeptide (TPR) repeat protein
MANKKLNIFFVVLIFVILSCNNNTNDQQVDNTKPMYGEVPKNLLYKMSDKKFRVESIGQFKTLDSAVIMYTEIAWDYFKHNDLETAMKRFNQVWLLNPEYPDSYFGFAALMEMQKNYTEAERFYKIGIKKDKKRIEL